MNNNNNDKIVVLYFEKHAIFINNELESIIISPNNTQDVKGNECIVETINITMSKEEILTISECLDSNFSRFNVGNIEINILDDYVFVYTDYKEIKISVKEIKVIVKYLIESEGIKMNESNNTQDIYNKIVSLDSSKPTEKIAKPIETVGQPPKKIQSIYDTVIDTMKQETKGENENGTK